MLASGCTHSYNNALSLGFSDKKKALAYQDFRQRQDAQLAEARRQAARSQPVAFDHRAHGQAPLAAAAPTVAPRPAYPEPGIQRTSWSGRMAPQNVMLAQSPALARTTPTAPSFQAGAGIAASLGDPSATQLRGSTRPVSMYGQVPGINRGRNSALDGNQNIKRVSFTGEGADFDVTINPPGDRLLYASTRHRETSDLYLQTIGGSAITQLTDHPANDVMPAFSPDGQRIAFASDRSGNWDIFIKDITGGQPIQLTFDATADLHPSFSPDGRSLVYSTFSPAAGQWQLVVIDVTNPAAKTYLGPGLFPSWSPVDDRILFQRARERGSRWFSVWSIRLINGEARQPTELVASDNAAVITPKWSPDGQHFVFTTVVDPEGNGGMRPQTSDVWIMTADGRQRSRMTQGRYANLQPVWSPDYTIYFVSDRAGLGVENIWSVRPDPAWMLATGGPQEEAGTESPSVMVPVE